MPAIDAKVFAALFETAPDAVLVIERDGRIVLANSQAEELFGIPRAELLGQQVETLMPDRHRAAHVGHRIAYMQKAETRRMGAGPSLCALRRDGTEFPVEIALSRIEAGDRVLYAASLRDVSEIARTRQAEQRGRYNSYVAQFEQPDDLYDQQRRGAHDVH